MNCDPGVVLQLVVAVAVLGATGLVLQRLGVSMLRRRTPTRSPRFWWMLGAFAGPLGIANQLLFCDGLFLQFALIVLVAGSGIWLADRLAARWR